MDGADFVQPGSGLDPIIGSVAQPHQFLGAAPVSKDPDQKPRLSFPAIVEMQGGGYFFAPSIAALRGLASPVA